MWADEPLKRLHSSGVLSILRLGVPNGLENLVLLGTLEVHDDFAVVGTQSKRGVIFSWDRGWRFVNIPEAEDVIYYGVKSIAGMNFLFPYRRNLDELSANLDNNLYLSLGL